MTDADRRSKLRAKSNFLKKAKKKHNYKFSYDYLPTYLPDDNKIVLRCKIHGKFETTTKQHLASKHGGCHQCRVDSFRTARGQTTASFIKRLIDLHGDRYDYSKIDYVNAHQPVTLVCPEHGEFTKQPRVLTAGAGCPECYKLHKTGNHSGSDSYSHGSWEANGEHSKYFDSYKVYVIFCTDADTSEKFIKIGRTFTTLARRFTKSAIPYEYVSLFQYEGTADLISKLEVALHQYFKTQKYSPLKPFAGDTECFAPNIKLTEGIPSTLSELLGIELTYTGPTYV